MAVSSRPVLPQAPKAFVQNFVQGTDAAGTYKTLVTAGADGTKVTSIVAATDDGSAAHVVTLAIKRSAVRYVIGAANVPVSSGTSGTAAHVDLMSRQLFPGLPVDNDGQPYLYLVSGDTLDVTFATALTAGKTIHVAGVGADF